MEAELTFQLAKDEQIDEFLELMRQEAADYVHPTLEKLGWSWEEFTQRARGVGWVYCVYRDEKKVGAYWIEERERVVHLHGIVIAPSYQGQGIGTQVLKHLINKYRGRMDAIELGVHASNVRAKALYERLGFRTVKVLPEVGFYILQYPLKEAAEAG
ncbi:GNAT family N-acetyltransferase [Thermanaerothrix sp.]|jgi:ribosomal protein S18 acetylase RimI-like enzyme|uniref:GNAT family N-acetyltransferase n=1 Tax=Thermanaerothrix sp. TaxID=2972675 RepID=UPI002ADE1B81|nr:GNAT family N-acetyltransferase [Thermanaerothrix sp.]